MKTKLWLRSIGLLSLFSISIVAYGQDGAAKARTATRPATIAIEAPAPQRFDLAAVSRVSAEIKRKRPNVLHRVLRTDAEVIQASLPEITAEFEKIGLTDEDALWASLRGWKSARLESPLRNNPDKTIDTESFINHVTNDVAPMLVRWQIQTENPGISKMVLKKDMRVIEGALDEIEASYEKQGWTASDARNVSLVAWKMVRSESALKPHQTINQESLIEFAGGFGIMIFTSEPDHADVFMGTEKIGTTNKEKIPTLYFPNGKRVTVRFTKPLFAPQEQECLAKGEDTVECKAELKPN